MGGLLRNLYALSGKDPVGAMHALVGKIPTSLAVGPEEYALYITCDDGSVLSLPTEGDCCSTSWWADAVGVKQLLEATVTGVDSIDMPAQSPDDGRSRQDCDEQYGYRITTSRGVCDLIFRNSSNGYYGGWCEAEWIAAVPDDVRPITEDWRA